MTPTARISPPATPAAALATALAIVVLQALLLHLMGRDAGCGCPDPLWQREMGPEGNSRHFADPYSFLHLGYGIAVFTILDMMRPAWPRRWLVLLVVLCSAIWEVMENLPVVIALFGYAPGDPLAYDGDSILNSLGDTAFAVAGGALAIGLPRPLAIAAVLLIEVAVSLSIRDGYVIALLRAAGLA